MTTARELAAKLAKAFLANGRYSLAGERASMPVGAADGTDALPMQDFGEFAGLEVHSVGYDPGEKGTGDEKDRAARVYIYVVKGAARHLRSLPRKEGDSPGRYCETLGWLSMSGINSSTFGGSMKPRGVPNPTRP